MALTSRGWASVPIEATESRLAGKGPPALSSSLSRSLIRGRRLACAEMGAVARLRRAQPARRETSRRLPAVDERVLVRVSLAAILAFSLLLRALLVARGGQMFWTDEERYLRAIPFWRALAEGRLGGAVDVLVAFPDHPGFSVVAALPALLHIWVAAALGAAPSLGGLPADPAAGYLGERTVD